MSENTFSHGDAAQGSVIVLHGQEVTCGFAVKASVLDEWRKLIIEGWFLAAERDSEEGTLAPFAYRRFPFERDGEPIHGARFLQFERGTFLITQASYCADNPHVEIKREIPLKREKRSRQLA